MQSLTAFLLAPILALAVATAPGSQQKSSPEEKKECGTTVPPEQLKAELTREAIARAGDVPPNERPLLSAVDDPHRASEQWHGRLYARPTGGRNAGPEPEVAARPASSSSFTEGLIILTTTLTSTSRTCKPTVTRYGKSMLSRTRSTFTSPICTGLCGEASFTATAVQGVLMDIDCAGSAANPSTFAHEIGHYFDLYHTHETFWCGMSKRKQLPYRWRPAMRHCGGSWTD